MRSPLTLRGDLPPHQQAIRARCVHPSGTFVEFEKAEIEQSIPARFEEMVRLYRDRVAIKTRTQAITYEELNVSANRIAQAILAYHGDAPAAVALLLEKGMPRFASTLGALKAGKFFILLDSSLPQARLTYMLEDSEASLLLTNTEHLAGEGLDPAWPPTHQCRRI